jgi:hypothetical protein
MWRFISSFLNGNLVCHICKKAIETPLDFSLSYGRACLVAVFLNFVSTVLDYNKFFSHGTQVGIRDVVFPYLILLGACFAIMRLTFRICAPEGRNRRKCSDTIAKMDLL